MVFSVKPQVKMLFLSRPTIPPRVEASRVSPACVSVALSFCPPSFLRGTMGTLADFILRLQLMLTLELGCQEGFMVYGWHQEISLTSLRYQKETTSMADVDRSSVIAGWSFTMKQTYKLLEGDLVHLNWLSSHVCFYVPFSLSILIQLVIPCRCLLH